MVSASPETSDLLTELPTELHSAAENLIKALRTESGLNQAFSDFCARAYVKPDWAGSASEFLVKLFEDHEDKLADMTRIPDLIIELASGHLTLTCMVAYRWAAHSDTARLAKLADALAATQSKVSAPEVTHIMLALVTSLAITRYPRAENMYAVAEPHTTEEHSEGMAEARQWLAAGRIIRGCSLESRELWDHRLRRKRTSWTWDEPNECAALAELADHLSPEQEGAELFRAITPPAWWDLAIKRVTENLAKPVLKVQESEKPEPIADLTEPPAWAEITAQSKTEDLEPNIIIWNGWPFVWGWLIGIIVLALMIWLSPYNLVDERTIKRASEVETSPKTTTAATTTIPKIEAEADSLGEIWRQEMAAKSAAEFTDLKPLFDQIHRDTWTQSENLLSGETPELPKNDPRYLKLIVWLHVDPPKDEEIRARIPGFLANIQANSDTLDLWQKLNYEGSPMRESIQAEAQKQFHSNKDSWSPMQETQLWRIGWPQ
jgi:hypothetical protein